MAQKISEYDKAAVRAFERWHKLQKKVFSYNAQGEEWFRDALQVAEDNGDVREICRGYSSLVSFLHSIGSTGRADQVLQEWVARFPESNEARLSAADYLWYTRWQTAKALAQLKRIRLPSHPDDDDVETYYLSQEMKGQLLLANNKSKPAVKQMQLLAEFTEANLDQLQFFFELRFVTGMVNKELGLEHCRRYLKALSRRNQVEHDQVATRKLLRKVNGLLKQQRRNAT